MKDNQLAKKWLGGGTGNKTVEKIADPLGIGDAYFSDDPSMGDTSADEAARQKAVQDWQGTMPAGYEKYGYAGDFTPTLLGKTPQLGQSEMAGITTDPRERDAQFAALSALGEQANTGLTAQDKADLANIESDANRANAGRQGAIRQNMAARGLSGSGAELAMAQQAADASAGQQSQADMQRAAMSENSRRAAVAALGQLGGQMQGQEFGQKAQQAQAQDAINRFNTQNSIDTGRYNVGMQNQAGMRNVDARQNNMNQNTQQTNNFNQQHFANQGAVSQLQYNQATNNINEAKQDYQNAVNNQNQKKAQVWQGIGSIGSAVGGIMASDEKLKKDKKGMSDGDIEEFLGSIKPKEYKYKNPAHGPGDRVGVMAQDLEKSNVGKKLVHDTPDGKALDVNNVIGALLDSVAYLHKKTKG